MRKSAYAILSLIVVLASTGSSQASVSLSSSPTKNMNCAAGVCAPTAKDAVLNVGDLTNMLATEDVKIVTGAGAVTITTFSPFSWTSTHRLTLDANQSVTFRAPVTVAGTGAVTIVTNDGGTGGDLIFFPGAKLDFRDTSSSLVIDTKSYVLVNDLASLAKVIANDQRVDVAFAADYDAARDGTYSKGAVITNFDGTFEGLGHSISNFTAAGAGDASVGLFSNIGLVFNEAVLRDLDILKANVATGDKGAAGILVGSIPFGRIAGVSVGGKVVGGDESDLGGLAGADGYGSITRCSSSATIHGGSSSDTGGLVGGAASIAYSYATGSVTSGSFSNTGGLAGFVEGDESHGQPAIVMQSWASGDVKSVRTNSIGGLAGGTGQAVQIHDTFAKGSVSVGGSGQIGGLLGWTLAQMISTSYSVGHVRYRSSPPNKPKVGGFIGAVPHDKTQHWTTLDYWNIDSSGQERGCSNRCPGVNGLTSMQLKSELPAGFDPAIWAQKPSINNGYPYLIANPPPQ